MAVQVRDPNTIHLGGDQTLVGDIAAGASVVTPGMLVDRASGVYIPHGVSTGVAQPAFALEQPYMNTGQDQSPHVLTIDEDYAVGDLMDVGIGHTGATYYALLASGQNVVDGAVLASDGAGALTASSTNPVVSAIEDVDNSAGPGNARIRVEVL